MVTPPASGTTTTADAVAGMAALRSAAVTESGSGPRVTVSCAAAVALKPDLVAGRFVEGLFYREASDREHLAQALRKAGLPA